MGDLQPGVGYNVYQSPVGDSLEILFPPPPDPNGPEQFKVEMYGDLVKVAKGRVVAQVLSSSTQTCLAEYNCLGFAVYPIDSLTVGSDANSPWASQDGSVEILKDTPGENPEDPHTGSDDWGVFLIRNVDGGDGQPERPYLAVMALNSEAYTYSEPWSDGATQCDKRCMYLVRSYHQVEVPVYPEGTVVGKIYVGAVMTIQGYNCQRLKIAHLTWVVDRWVITQNLIGTLYMPNNVHFCGEVGIDLDNPDPQPTGWPIYATENGLYQGTWAGYTKNFNQGGPTNTTQLSL